MYMILRYLITAVFAIALGLLIWKKHIQVSKGIVITIVIVLLLIPTLLTYLPFENLLVSFSSPECVFSYMKEGEILIITEGEKSCLVLFDLNGLTKPYIKPSIMVIPKTDAGYKIGTPITMQTRLEMEKNGLRISILRCKNTDDYYVRVFTRTKDTNVNVSDNCGSVFNNYAWKSTGFDTSVWSCAYIKNIPTDYMITIDGNTVDVSIPLNNG